LRLLSPKRAIETTRREKEMGVGRYKVENFQYREARLMDKHAYDE
jgi:hypothetical protein